MNKKNKAGRNGPATLRRKTNTKQKHPQYTLFPRPMQEAVNIAKAAGLHQDLAYFYLDKASEVCGTATGAFGFYFGLALNCLTCYEILNRKASDA